MSGRAVGCGSVYPAPEWTFCCWPDCGTVIDGGGLPLCDRHYDRVGRQYVNELAKNTAALLSASRPPSQREHLTARDAAMAAQSQVYYVRIGDHVKIGYTINMRQRLGSLRVDDDALLATEPGGRELESQRHLQFVAERQGRRENFNPSRRLLAHIEAVRAEHGNPKITTYPSVLLAD